MGVTCNFGEVFEGIDALREHLENPKPVLRAWSNGYRAEVKAVLDAGGIGSKPYAESTLKRMQGTGTSLVTSRGDVRSDRVKRTAKAIKRNAGALERNGWSPDWQKKQDSLAKRLAGYQRAERSSAAKSDKVVKLKASVTERTGQFLGNIKAINKLARDRERLAKISTKNIGKKQSEARQHPLQNMAKTIRAKVYDDSIKIYSAAMDTGLAHDQGAGPGDLKKGSTPQREFIKVPGFDSQVDRLAHMLETDLEEAFDG